MSKAYEVIIPWFGKAKGDIVTFNGDVPHALRPNVRPVPEVLQEKAVLEVATPKGKQGKKKDVKKTDEDDKSQEENLGGALDQE